MAKKYSLEDYKEKVSTISNNKVEEIQSIFNFIDELWNQENTKKIKKFLYFLEINIQYGILKNNVDNFLEYYSIKGKVTKRKMILTFQLLQKMIKITNQT